MTASRAPAALAAFLATASLLPAAHAAEPALNPLAAIDKSSLKAFVEQPLFEPSRHPPFVPPPVAYVAPPPPPPMPEPPPSLRLIGLVEGLHSAAAVVHRNDTGRTETLHAGDHIGSWLVELMPAALRVVNGERAFDYALFRGGAQQGPVPVATPVPRVASGIAARDANGGGGR